MTPEKAPMTHSAKAAVVEAGGSPFTLSSIELDEPRADEVLVRMVAAGLCHTDLGVAGGDQVLLSFTSCGTCANCRDGHPAYCATWLPLNLIGGTRADGSTTISRDGQPLGGHFFGQSSFSDLALVDERSLVKLPDDAALQTLAP